MPWSINSEIFPNWARARCTSITTSFNWAANIFVSLTFLTLTENMTKHGQSFVFVIVDVQFYNDYNAKHFVSYHQRVFTCIWAFHRYFIINLGIFSGTFYLYMSFALSGLALFFFILPETKGVKLEEVEGIFQVPFFSQRPWKKKEADELINSEEQPSYGSLYTLT